MKVTATGTDVLGRTGSTTVVVGPRPALLDLPEDDVDQAENLNAQLRALPDDTTAYLTHEGQSKRVRLDRTARHPGRGITVDGRKSFVGYTDRTGIDLGIISDHDGSSKRTHWLLASAATLRGVAIEGPNKSRNPEHPAFSRPHQRPTAFEHGYAIQGAAKKVLLEDFNVTQVWGDNVYAGGTGEPVRDVTIRRGVGTYCARQQLGLTNFDGLLVEDVEMDFGGSSGCDVEPNHATHNARNGVFRRVGMGSYDYPWVIGGVLGATRRENILLEDCVGRRTVGNHTAILATRGGTNLVVRDHIDLRQPSQFGINLYGWDGVDIDGARITTTKMTPVSAAVRLSSCIGRIRIRHGVFNGRNGEGFDELFSVAGTTDPASFEHYLNEWAMGTKHDGPMPADDPSTP